MKSIVASLLGGIVSTRLGYGLIGTFARLPLIGTLATAATLPLMAGAVTYGIGKVFVQHFASGGTFLDFNPDKVRGFFRGQVEKAKDATATAAA